MTWKINGISGEGNLPRVANGYNGICLIIAGGACVWKDIRAFFRLIGQDFSNSADFDPKCDVMAINDIGAFFKPRIVHLASYHEELCAPLVYLRRIHGCNAAHAMTHCYKHYREEFPSYPEPVSNGSEYKLAEVAWRFEQGMGGTSGLLGVMVAIGLGYKKIILAGMPMDGQGHFFDEKRSTFIQFKSSETAKVWIQARDDWMADRVRSMSGRTQDWLGAPTREWLNGIN